MPVPADFQARLESLLQGFERDDLELVVELVTLVAYADGEIDGDELEALRKSLEAMFRSPLALLVVKTLVGSAIDEIKAAGADAYATQLGKEYAEREKADEALKVAIAIARANGEVSSLERQRIVRFAEGAGLTEARVAELEAG